MTTKCGFNIDHWDAAKEEMRQAMIKRARFRGMLTVIVVHRDGDMEPGPGFFELARELGRDTSDILRCWIEELKKVHKVWSGEYS